MAIDFLFQKSVLFINFENSFIDSSPLGLTLTTLGSPAIVSGSPLFGKAVFFDGATNQYVRAQSSSLVMGSKEITFDAFIYPNNASGVNINAIMDIRTSALGANVGFYLYINGTTLTLGLENNATYMTIPGVINNAKNHVRFSRRYSLSSGTLYSHHRLGLNGVSVEVLTGSATAYTNDTITIGSYYDNSKHFSGFIDEVKYMPVARDMFSQNGVTTSYPYFDDVTDTSSPAPTVTDSKGYLANQLQLPSGLPLAVNSPIIGNISGSPHYGNGYITGVVKTAGIPNVPTRARVVLYCETDRQAVSETWSDATTGVYTFTGLNMDETFVAIAYDATKIKKVARSSSKQPISMYSLLGY